jgi:hypothetical protein
LTLRLDTGAAALKNCRITSKLCDDSLGLDSKGFVISRDSVAGSQLSAT